MTDQLCGALRCAMMVDAQHHRADAKLNAACGSRRLPRYLPIPLSLPLPLDCRQIVLMTTADCAIGHGAHERRLRRRAAAHTDHADNSELEADD